MFYNKNGMIKQLSTINKNDCRIDVKSGSCGNTMVRKKPDYISRFSISRDVVTRTKEFFIKMGARHREGLVFWSGTLQGDGAYIKTAICPPNISTCISARTNDQGLKHIYETLRKNDEFLFIQAHSHPDLAFHSPTDCDEAISFKKGFMSIVVPFYGRNMEDISTWVIFEYSGTDKWRQLGRSEITNRFIVI